MEIRYPDYYSRFRCIASACPDSCCKEWDVDVDPDSAAMYRSLSGPLGDRLRQVLRSGDDGWATMTITDGRCPMWRDDGLCQIQAELGHGALCATCREFPRLTHDYGSFTECGLELSCPEAARLILTAPATAYVTETVSCGETPTWDPNVMAVLKTSREQALTLLHDETIPLGHALAALLLYGYDIQDALDFPDSMPESLNFDEYLRDSVKLAHPGSMRDIFSLYANLEILTLQWRELLARGPILQPWAPEHRRLAQYLVERYWLHAISDFDLLCRVKFIAAACLTVKHLDGSIVRAAQLWSKEIENNADNVDALLDAAYTSPALADVKLLGLLLE